MLGLFEAIKRVKLDELNDFIEALYRNHSRIFSIYV